MITPSGNDIWMRSTDSVAYDHASHGVRGSVSPMGHEDRDLLPLGSAFDVVRRGYDREQVDEHLDRLDADLRILAADRDAAVARAAELAKQVENQRAQIVNHQRELGRLASAPTSMEGMSERLQRMLRLAQEEAADIRAQAEAEASERMSRAEADGGALRDRYQRLIAELDNRRADMETEHRTVMEQARTSAAKIVADAKSEAEKIEAKSAALHRQVEEDFDIAMSARRADAMRVLAEREATSKAEAGRRVAEATAEANRRLQEAIEASARQVAEAQAEVDRLRTLRAKISAQLRQVRLVLAEATDAIEPLTDEQVGGPSTDDPSTNDPGLPTTPPQARDLGVDSADADKPMVDGEPVPEDATQAIPTSRARPVAANSR
jgi:DivIVA domain-containing protein